MSGRLLTIGVMPTGYCEGKPVTVERRCDTCRCWERLDRMIDYAGEAKFVPSALGICYRYPKKINTDNDHWCMEYRHGGE